MGRLGRFIVVAIAQGIIGWLAVGTIVAAVEPGPLRDVVVLAI